MDALRTGHDAERTMGPPRPAGHRRGGRGTTWR